jgi:hypothetical protein
MTELPTAETMGAACKAAIAIDRAMGVPLPESEESDLVYAIGFAAGADWGLKRAKEVIKGIK